MDGRTERLRTDRQPLVTLIIPSYNDAANLAHTIPLLRLGVRRRRRRRGHLRRRRQPRSHRRGHRVTHPRLVQARLIRIPWNQGKGGAVKAGVGIARGDRLVFMDADLSADLADLPRSSSRSMTPTSCSARARSPVSRVTYAQDRTIRKAQSKFFNGVACAMAGVLASDTQCGFKAFRADSAKLLFHLVEGQGFRLRRRGARARAAPRAAHRRGPGALGRGPRARPSDPVRDPLIMLRDLLRTRRRCRHLEQCPAASSGKAPSRVRKMEWQPTDVNNDLPVDLRAADGAPDRLLDLSTVAPETPNVVN